MIIESAFKPAWWLQNAHAQTLVASLLRWQKVLIDRIERLELPDGDFIDLAWVDNHANAKTPLVIILHGLSGSMNSPYIAAQIKRYKAMGWRIVVMHFRGASGQPNRMLRAYHCGDTADLDFFLKTLATREPYSKKYGVGFSLGGNVLLKWLGEQGSQDLLSAAVAVSVPFQLNRAADRVNVGFSRLYQFYLLRQLRQLMCPKLVTHRRPELQHVMNTSTCFWTFDDRITAPIHGFSSVDEYYDHSSCKTYLARVTTPTLIIHAKDDPFLFADAIPTATDLSPFVTLELSEHGGHVGFIGGNVPGRPVYWLDQRIPDFLTSLAKKY